MITLATEMFIQHLSEAGHNIVRSERKPRRNIQYRDLAAAVARADNLEFLSDIVPKTVPFKEVKGKKAPTMVSANGVGLNANGNGNGNGESSNGGEGSKGMMNGTLNGFVGYGAHAGVGNGEGLVGGEESAEVDDDSTIADPNEQLRMEDRGESAQMSNGSSVVNGRRGSEDVEMDD